MRKGLGRRRLGVDFIVGEMLKKGLLCEQNVLSSECASTSQSLTYGARLACQPSTPCLSRVLEEVLGRVNLSFLPFRPDLAS